MISVAYCSEHTETDSGNNKGADSVSNNQSSSTALSTPPRPIVYTYEDNKENSRSALNITNTAVNAVKIKHFNDKKRRGSIFSQISVQDSNGIDLDDVRKIARNLNSEFVEAAVDTEKVTRQEQRKWNQK